MTFPEDDFEFRQAWSQIAGESVALSGAVCLAEEKAAQAYIQRQDAVALALRDLAQALSFRAKDASAALRAYIEEDGRRTHMRRHKPDEEQRLVDEWNRQYPIGTPIVRYPIMTLPLRDAVNTITRSVAWVLEGHTAVIQVEGKSGCVALRSVTPQSQVPKAS